MRPAIKKIILHILFWSAALAYLVFAPALYVHWFVADGNNTGSLDELPDQAVEFRANLEYLQLSDKKGTYELEGWSFLTMDDALPVEEYKREIILASPQKIYTFEAGPYGKDRGDVTEFYASMGKDLGASGFRSKISIYALKPDDYKVLILFRSNDGEAVYIDTYRCLTRTPNNLILKERGSSCY